MVARAACGLLPLVIFCLRLCVRRKAVEVCVVCLAIGCYRHAGTRGRNGSRHRPTAQAELLSAPQEHPSHFTAIGGIGIEIWTMSNGIAYDNLLVTHDETVAAEVAAKTWKLKSEREKTKAKSGAVRLRLYKRLCAAVAAVLALPAASTHAARACDGTYV